MSKATFFLVSLLVTSTIIQISAQKPILRPKPQWRRNPETEPLSKKTNSEESSKIAEKDLGEGLGDTNFKTVEYLSGESGHLAVEFGESSRSDSRNADIIESSPEIDRKSSKFRYSARDTVKSPQKEKQPLSQSSNDVRGSVLEKNGENSQETASHGSRSEVHPSMVQDKPAGILIDKPNVHSSEAEGQPLEGSDILFDDEHIPNFCRFRFRETESGMIKEFDLPEESQRRYVMAGKQFVTLQDKNGHPFKWDLRSSKFYIMRRVKEGLTGDVVVLLNEFEEPVPCTIYQKNSELGPKKFVIPPKNIVQKYRDAGSELMVLHDKEGKKFFIMLGSKTSIVQPDIRGPQRSKAAFKNSLKTVENKIEPIAETVESNVGDQEYAYEMLLSNPIESGGKPGKFHYSSLDSLNRAKIRS